MSIVMQHNFAQTDAPNVPHSVFDRSFTHKTTMDADYLVPFMIDEVVPGDSFAVDSNFLIRFNDLLKPFMDNLYFDTFYFFVPYRLIWDNWTKMCGEQDKPGDSTDYSVPQVGCWVTADKNDVAWEYCKPGSLADYFGVPVSKWSNMLKDAGITTGSKYCCPVSALPFRAYRLIWNEWFRDENLQNSVTLDTGDGYRALGDVGALLKRGKRHDYFTSALPWPQKGPAVSLPLGLKAPVGIDGTYSNGGSQSAASGFFPLVGSYYPLSSSPVVENSAMYNSHGGALSQRFAAASPAYFGIGSTGYNGQLSSYGSNNPQVNPPYSSSSDAGYKFSSAYADLSQATAVTVNQLREAFAVQRVYERDARGGTRYTEILQAHFGVANPDARLQRPEYLGGSSQRLSVTSVPQTSASTNSSSQANLAAYSVSGASSGFRKTFGEYGILIGLCNVRADLTYQQGLPRFFRKKTRFDFYWSALAFLGEQEVYNSEIYCDTNVLTSSGSTSDPDVAFTAADNAVFGYQERYAEYRYKPSQVSGLLNSDADGSLDFWHLSQYFANRPALNASFIESDTPLARVSAVSDEPLFLIDAGVRMKCARPMPVYSTPGLIDHF